MLARTKTPATKSSTVLPDLSLTQFPAYRTAADRLAELQTELRTIDTRSAELRETVANSPEVERLRQQKAAHEADRTAVVARIADVSKRHAAEKNAKARGKLFREGESLERQRRSLDSTIRADADLVRAQMAKPRMSVDTLRYLDPVRASKIEGAEVELKALDSKRGPLAEAVRITTGTVEAARQSALRQLRGELTPEHDRLHADLADALRRLHEAGDALAAFERTASGAGIELASKLPGRWQDFREKSREWLTGVSQVWSTASPPIHR